MHWQHFVCIYSIKNDYEQNTTSKGVSKTRDNPSLIGLWYTIVIQTRPDNVYANKDWFCLL